MPDSCPLRIVVLISGNGSNLQAIIDAIAHRALYANIEAVVTNQADANGLLRAQHAGIPTHVVSPVDYTSREQHDQALQQLIDGYHPQLVVLAGYMRILSEAFVLHYSGRMINIHPSLLPQFRGLNTHQRALAAGAHVHGATVHYVTPELDGGPAIIQAHVQVTKNDTVETLAAKVLAQEHVILPMAIHWIAQGRVQLQGNHVELDGNSLQAPILYKAEQ